MGIQYIIGEDVKTNPLQTIISKNPNIILTPKVSSPEGSRVAEKFNAGSTDIKLKFDSIQENPLDPNKPYYMFTFTEGINPTTIVTRSTDIEELSTKVMETVEKFK